LPAAYHGGKLNGVDCCEIIHLDKPLFSHFETQLLSVAHFDRSCGNKIINFCHVYHYMCHAQHMASKIRMKCSEPKEDDYQLVDICLGKLHKLWGLRHFNFTPKMHCLLNQGLEHMLCFGGIGDTLKDNVKHMLQISARIEL
jgi:hypothetical protein